MSTNIDNIEIICSDRFRVSRAKAEAADAEVGGEGPEGGPFEDLRYDADGYAKLTRFSFCGEMSGSTYYDGAFDAYAEATEGSADLLLIWENGALEGVRVCDGTVTRHKVIVSLGEEEVDS